MSNRFSEWIARVFPGQATPEPTRAHLTLSETENAFFVGTRRTDESVRDRTATDRGEILEQCLQAWRESPIGRRVVELTSQYVVGNGFDMQCDHGPTRVFLDQFWAHPADLLPHELD